MKVIETLEMAVKIKALLKITIGIHNENNSV